MILEDMSLIRATALSHFPELVRERMREHKLLLVQEIAEDVRNLVILADRRRLKQVLFNLLSNAVKFTESGGVRIEIGPGQSQRTMRFRVLDTGIGMSPEQLSRVLSPFEQGDGSITRKFGGTGLGLTITQRIARTLGGDIAIVSAPNAGTTVTLSVARNLTKLSSAA